VVTRRGLLVAGGAVLLAGCGKPESTAIAPGDAVRRSLAAEQAVVAAYDGLDGPGVAALTSRARARAESLQSALGDSGGTSPAPAAAPSLEGALEAERRALQAHVAGVGATTDRQVRALLASAITDTAQSEARLAQLLGRDPLVNPFPGEPG
jgi:hypothetical protein